jgi:hypothetical protein
VEVKVSVSFFNYFYGFHADYSCLDPEIIHTAFQKVV